MMTQQLEGRELDAAIAERVFGHKVEKKGGEFFREQGEWSDSFFVPRYSETMHFTWHVAEWIREETGVFILEWNGFQWEVFYGKDNYNYLPPVKADTPSEAICHAALELKERLEAKANALEAEDA